MSVYIVIAAYNEEKSIISVIKDLRDCGYKNIIIVDDGSKDDTSISAKDAIVLRHTINRGQGAALKTGIDYALLCGAEIIVTFDADGQHSAKDIKSMISTINEGYDVVLGSRFLGKKTQMPFTRYLTLKIAIYIQWIFYGLLLTDAHNGLRVFSRKAAQKIRITSDRMEHASEIIEQLKTNKLKFKENSVTVNYTRYSIEKGHGGFMQAVNVFFKMVFHKLIRY